MAKFDDVRMRGFQHRAEVADALALIDSRVALLGSEWNPVTNSHTRVLAADIVAPVNVPGFARAAMDGYAVQARDTFGAEATNAMVLNLVGESMPGVLPNMAVGKNQAVRIMTGAPMPTGADAVVPAEVAEELTGQVAVKEAVTPGRHVGRVGEDVSQGKVILFAGRTLRPQDLGILVALGIREIPVVRQPRVALFVTGNELLPPGCVPTGVQIVDSNSPILESLAKRDGAIWSGTTYLADHYDTVRDTLASTAADVVLVSGGTSVGREDYAPKALAEVGTLNIHGMALRPASPTGLGFRSGVPVFLLPGNPVSCLCAYDLFVGRAIRVMGGRGHEMPYRKVSKTLAEKIVSALGRVDYVRVKFMGEGEVEPLAVSGASILSTTVFADGFVLVDSGREGYAAGDVVEVSCYDSPY